MYHRYGDKHKFITDIDQLQVTDDEVVYISKEEDYDIAFDLEGCYDTFENLKSFMITIAEHICEMDDTVIKFDQTTRFNNKPLKFARLPCPNGFLRFDYAKCIEKEPVPTKKKFSFILVLIYIEQPNFVTFDYWATNENNQFTVTFEYKDGKFYLRTFGSIDCIPDDWDKKS